MFKLLSPMKPNLRKAIGILTLLVLLASCATILSGSKQAIRITSLPEGAKVLVNGKDLGLVTPCMAVLKRKVGPSAYNNKNEYHFLFTKEGYANSEVVSYRKINPKIYWNVCAYFLVLATVPVDFVTGAAYMHDNVVYSGLQELNNPKVNEEPKLEIVDKTPPNIIITYPNLDRGFKPIWNETQITISGKAEDESGIFEVKINGIEATVIEDGTFEAIVPLTMGRNKINILAKDNRMNTASESFYIERTDQIVQDIVQTDNSDKMGSYHALIIGVQNYNDPAFRNLENPIKDAHKLYDALTTYYNFNPNDIILLENPKSNEITSELEKYFNSLTSNDNLLIFYAGHGYWDPKFKQGYWLPSDAQESNRGSWLSNSTIRDYMRAISAKHSMLITDACFAGGIFNSRDPFPDASKAINKMYDLPSRKAMTSGAMNQVPDKSVFIDYLIKRLETNQEKYLSAEQLFASFKLAVINNSPQDQVPQFGEVKETGDEGGDFIFVKKNP